MARRNYTHDDANHAEEQQSFGLALYKVVRQLKRERSGVFHCACSILDDAAFVDEVRGLYPGVPAVANLRCGLWYVSPPCHTCYFKSTDGHVGQWTFSTVRLNLHVAHLAAQHGAALIVDATRNANKGGFPDALSRTIPIWAAVVNRAIGRIRQSAAAAATAATTAPAAHEGGTPSGLLHWDDGLHLPLWASRNEVQQVAARLDGWVDTLLATHPQAVQDLARVLHKPLRPLWISQHSHIWVDQVAQPHELDFAPLILVTASKPVVGERRLCPLSRRARARAAADEQDMLEAASYVYQPGAGDDEESWAMGLTPDLQWAHQQELISAGPEHIEQVIKQLVQQQGKEGVQGPGTPGTAGTASLATDSGRPITGWSQHNLPPLGCRNTSQPATVQHLGSGAFAIRGTPLVLGARSACGSPAAEQAAVLFLGIGPPTDQGQQQQQQQDGIDWQNLGSGETGPLEQHPARYRRRCWVHATADKREQQALLHALPHVVAWARHHLADGRTLLIHDEQGTGLCVAAAVAVALTCSHLQGWNRDAAAASDAPQAPPSMVSKEDIRRTLARLADSYPFARPSRSMLKQVQAFLCSPHDRDA